MGLPSFVGADDFLQEILPLSSFTLDDFSAFAFFFFFKGTPDNFASTPQDNQYLHPERVVTFLKCYKQIVIFI